MKKYTLFFLFSLPLLHLSAQQRIYVNHAATGAATGQNWANAYTDLQLALQSAAYGDTMWVAAGTYKPTHDNNRDSSFRVPNGLRLYGGFSGTETELAQRDWAANPVVLSGDIGVADDTLDNSYSIMYMAYPDSFTIVDGFTFRFGYAQPAELVFEDGTEPFICGGALYIMGFEGSAYADIRHCTFEYNYAWAGGGAVFVNGDGEDASVAPRFLDCTFRYNYTAGYGGAIGRLGGSWAERYPDFGDCVFERNFALQWGGALYYFDTERTDTLHVSGCRFTENSGEGDAGAMALSIARISGASLIIRNSVFDKNVTKWGTSSCIRQNLSFLLLNNFIISNSRFSNQNKQLIRLLGEASQESSLRQIDRCNFDTIQGGVNLESRKTIVVNDCDINASQFGIGAFIGSDMDKHITIKGNSVKKSDFVFKSQVFNVHLDISNNTFIENILANAASFFQFESSAQFPPPFIRNSTFINNGGTPQNFQPESAFETDYDVIYQNCLFYSAKIDTMPLPPFPDYDDQIIFDHCYFDTFGCSDQLYYAVCGEGTIIGGDPGFVDAAAGDYRLSACSMLRDAGNNEGLEDVPTDLAGQQRIQDGRVDIGAYETPGFGFSAPATVLPVCSETSPGSIALHPSSGCLPYTVSWQNGMESGDALTGLPAGTYYLSLTDQAGRLLRDTITILQPPPLEVQVDSIAASGMTVADGALISTVSGGAEPYLYDWSNGDSASTADMLLPGMYQLTLTDQNGCTFTGAYSVPFVIGTESAENAPGALLYPNPAEGGATMLYLRGWPSVTATLDCYDTKGKLAGRWSLAVPGGEAMLELSVQTLPAGIYRCVLYSGDARMVLPLGVVK